MHILDLVSVYFVSLLVSGKSELGKETALECFFVSNSYLNNHSLKKQEQIFFMIHHKMQHFIKD